MERPLTLTDVESLARERLDPHWYEYFAGGAGTESTLRANRAAFERHLLRQRVLRGIDEPSTEATVLGQSLGMPVIVAPVAYQEMAHPDAEVAMARAAAATGAGFCLSTFATRSPEVVAESAPGGARFLQVYVFRDHAVTEELVAQAIEVGYTAVFLTVDLPVVGPRDRERRIVWTFPDESLPGVQYALTRGVPGKGMDILDPALDWGYLERLCESVPVPVVVKGVLDVADAVLAAEHGVQGIVVSNHGGRQLDPAPATIDVLPEVVDAVGDRLEIMVDGGIRRGSDVAVALALGARAVLAGRQPLWGLAAGGENGARQVLGLLREELVVALHLTGCSAATDLSRHHLSRAARE